MLTSLNIKNPGLRTLPPGVERYYVRGGGLSVIEVLPEDKIEIVNDEGKQTCEIVVFNSKGKSDLSILNLKENSNANFSKKTISQDEKISKTDSPPPLTKYLSTPGGKARKPGFLIARLVSIMDNRINTWRLSKTYIKHL